MVDVIVLGLNRFGERIYKWLLEQDDTTVQALITHKEQYNTIKKLEPELIVSAGFRFIVPEEILQIPSRGAVNLHPSYLPYNKGANPNVWSIIEDVPAGVSVHYMVPEVDSGPIIGRKKVPVYPDDDGRSLYRRLEREQITLFKEVWDDIREGQAETIIQNDGVGTNHYKQDFSDLFEIDLNEQVKAGDLIDRLRALTFPPYNNAYFEKDGEKYFIEVDVTPGSEVEGSDGIHFNIPEY